MVFSGDKFPIRKEEQMHKFTMEDKSVGNGTEERNPVSLWLDLIWQRRQHIFPKTGVIQCMETHCTEGPQEGYTTIQGDANLE